MITLIDKEKSIKEMTVEELNEKYDKCMSDHKTFMRMNTRLSRKFALQLICQAEAIENELHRRLLKAR